MKKAQEVLTQIHSLDSFIKQWSWKDWLNQETKVEEKLFPYNVATNLLQGSSKQITFKYYLTTFRESLPEKKTTSTFQEYDSCTLTTSTHTK